MPTKTFLITGVLWLVSVCGQGAGWGAPYGFEPSGGTAMWREQRARPLLARQAIHALRRVSVICCDPRDRGGQATERPSLPIDPKVRASMQVLEDCMVSLVRLKKEMRTAQLVLRSSSGPEASELRAMVEGSLLRQEDYLNQTIRLYNALSRTLSELFEELYKDVSR